MELKHVKHSFIPSQFYFSLMIIIEIKKNYNIKQPYL